MRRFAVGRLLTQSVRMVNAHSVSSPFSQPNGCQLSDSLAILALACTPPSLAAAPHSGAASSNLRACRPTSCVSNCPTSHRAFRLSSLQSYVSSYGLISYILYLIPQFSLLFYNKIIELILWQSYLRKKITYF